MKITYLGHACFIIETNSGVKILTDPYTKVGYELPCGIQADVVLVSHSHFDHNYLAAVQGNPLVIDKAGDFEAFGVKIRGEHSWHDPMQGALRGANVIFQIEADGITLCHFGDLGEPLDQISKKSAFYADVWLLPIGGTYTIDSEEAWKYIQAYQPKMVIPMHYRPQDGALDIKDASEFLQKADKNLLSVYPNGQFLLKKEDLNTQKTKIIYMERCHDAKERK